MRRIGIALCLLLACAAMAGCGNKGPLVRPGAKAPAASTSSAHIAPYAPASATAA